MNRRCGVRATRELRRDTRLRRARTCDDPLAGVAAVSLLDGLLARRWLARPRYDKTAKGERALVVAGVAVARACESARLFAWGCFDWTERWPHVAGALGAAGLRALVSARAVRRRPGSRVVMLASPPACWLARSR